MRVLPLLLVFALGVGAAFLLSCGGSNSKLIPVSDAGQINAQVDSVEAAVANGTASCSEAAAAAARAREVVVNLPKSVDSRLRDRLLSAISRLKQRAETECRQQTGSVTTEIPTTTTTAPDTTTQAPDTTTQPPPDTTTQPPPDTTTVPPADTTPTTPTTTPDSTGGVAPGDGTTTPSGVTP
jgi:outer membrane murein-binding lipoprotein Lpp